MILFTESIFIILYWFFICVIILIDLEPAACQANEFRCGDGTCISNDLKCDRKYDCQDGLDELLCGRFQCFFFGWTSFNEIIGLHIEKTIVFKQFIFQSSQNFIEKTEHLRLKNY